MGLTKVRMEVSNPTDSNRRKKIDFLVDSGAIYSVVPRGILRSLGIESDSIESFSLADVTCIERATGQAGFTFEERTRIAPVVFGEEGDSTLLGVTTLEALGLVLDPIRREIRPMALRL